MVIVPVSTVPESINAACTRDPWFCGRVHNLEAMHPDLYIGPLSMTHISVDVENSA